MFINVNKITNVRTDELNRPLVNIEETVFLFDGQTPNEKVLSKETQQYYKKLYKIQEEATIAAGRPVCIFEALGLGLTLNS